MQCPQCGEQNDANEQVCKKCGNPLVISNPVVTVAPVATLLLPASWTKRLLNFIIDSIARYVFGGIIAAILVMAGTNEDIVVWVAFVAIFGYHFIFEVAFQRTVGKMLTGTKVVNLQGEMPSVLALLGRSLARYIPFEPFSFLFYGSYPTKGWHDRFSHTLVVPVALTPEQVRSFDYNSIALQKQGNGASVILVVCIAGFLILSVVGILGSVVLASLNSAREKGQDAMVKATIINYRANAELYYEENSESYLGVCSDPDVLASVRQNSSEIDLVCNDEELAYAIAAPLKAGGYYCVDNTGSSAVVSDPLGGKTSCEGL